MTVSRRALLLGGSGLALAGCGVPGTGAAGDRSVNGSFTSTAMKGARLGWRISYPRGHQTSDRLPVVLSLHGRGNDHGTSFSDLHLDGARDKAVDVGATPFVIAAVDGGDHSYWHRRKDGTDAGKMLRDEFLPLLDKRGLDTGRLGLFGWSMGGYGALLLVGRNVLTPLGVAVSSPALFTSAGATAAGAFDDPADFDRNDVYAHPRWLANTPAPGRLRSPGPVLRRHP